jgi:hypothetical protein
MPRQFLGERPLAGSGGTIDGDDDRFFHRQIPKCERL